MKRMFESNGYRVQSARYADCLSFAAAFNLIDEAAERWHADQTGQRVRRSATCFDDA